MRVEKVYELLQKLKDSSSDVNIYGRKILKYIYQDVYFVCFDKEREKAATIAMQSGAKVGSDKYNECVELYDKGKKKIGIFLDGDCSILTYFNEMVNDNKEDFMRLFFDKLDLYFDIIDNHFYTDSDFRVYSLTFNIYSMLKAYHEHKNNFEVYSKIVDDCSSLIDCNVWFNEYIYSFSKLSEKKRAMDVLISCDGYLVVNEIRKSLKDVLDNILNGSKTFDIKDLEKDVILINQIISDYNELKNKFLIRIPVSSIISKCVFKEQIYTYYPFYAKILLIDDRLEYINHKLVCSFDEKSYRNDAFKLISALDVEFFEYLKTKEQYNGVDPFIYCMDIVFDSDTYYEFNSKMQSLSEACTLFKTDKEAALELVKGLNDVDHKKQIDGEVLNLQNNAINLCEKEHSIFGRMVSLYEKTYKDTSLNMFNLMKEVLRCTDLYHFDDFLTSVIQEKLKCIEACRLIEEFRQNEIKHEVEILRTVIQNQQDQTNDENNMTVKQEENDGKGIQKIKSLFGKKK